jgi:hypothetical protein
VPPAVAFWDWALWGWLTCKGFWCIISGNDEGLIGDLNGQEFSC